MHYSGEMFQTDMNSNSFTSTIYNYDDKLKKEKHGLSEKKFYHRESVITVLLENPHVKTIYHLAIVLFLGFCLTTFIRCYLENNGTTTGFRLIAAGFKNFHISILIWIFIYSLGCFVYFVFCSWARLRSHFLPNSSSRRVYDISSLLVLLGYYVFSFSFIGHMVTKFDLASGSAAFILLEQARLLMKIHAFVRSNAPKALQFEEKTDKTLVLPTFRHFVFFTWIPTLVYKDEYPRTNGIRWKKVVTYTLEILAVVFFYSFFFERFLNPLFKDFGLRKFSRSDIFLAFLETVFPSAMHLVVSFYLILHLVQNLFAELLCFGDRMFYKDWWTSTDFATYFRKWNVVVHDWLYAYVYRDCYENWFPGCRHVAKYVTFFVSSVVHEWIMCNMLGYFLPIMFIQFFGLGPTLTYIKLPQNAVLNMLLWLGLTLGQGIILTLYCLEFYARDNGVPSTAGSLDFYIPRLLTCNDCYT